MLILLVMSLQIFVITQARTCYPLTNTSKPYHVLDKTIVETPRGCEVFCEANSKCVGFSYQDSGLNSSYALLSPNNANEICTKPTTIFLKQTTGCPDRINLTAEYGNDPCIDTFEPASVDSNGHACSLDLRSKQYILRVVTSDGIRKSVHSGATTSVQMSEDMWEYRHSDSIIRYSEKVVSAVCASAGPAKCPCDPLTQIKTYDGQKSYEVTPNVMNPCPIARTKLLLKAAHGGDVVAWIEPADALKNMITCKAGMWYRWSEQTSSMQALFAAACITY